MYKFEIGIDRKKELGEYIKKLREEKLGEKNEK